MIFCSLMFLLLFFTFPLNTQNFLALSAFSFLLIFFFRILGFFPFNQCCKNQHANLWHVIHFWNGENGENPRKSFKYSWRKMKIYREKSSKTNLPGNLLRRSLHLRCNSCFWCATNGMIIHPWFIQCFKRIIKKAFYANWISLFCVFLLHFMEIFRDFSSTPSRNGVWWLFTLCFFCGFTINSAWRGEKLWTFHHAGA